MKIYKVHSKEGYVFPKDHIKSCLGEWWRFDFVVRGPNNTDGKPATLRVHNERKGRRTMHASVFGLTVSESEL